jgi:hypothetical protein
MLCAAQWLPCLCFIGWGVAGKRVVRGDPQLGGTASPFKSKGFLSAAHLSFKVRSGDTARGLQNRVKKQWPLVEIFSDSNTPDCNRNGFPS